MELRVLAKEGFRTTQAFGVAHGLANDVHAYMCEPDTAERIAAANRPGASSAEIQAVLLDKATDLGFTSERRGLFSGYSTTGLTPDYYMPLKAGGIIFEVERGKTTINNMDLLDLWKCHICAEANVLFLAVPIELRQNVTMTRTTRVQHGVGPPGELLPSRQRNQRRCVVPVRLLTSLDRFRLVRNRDNLGDEPHM